MPRETLLTPADLNCLNLSVSKEVGLASRVISHESEIVPMEAILSIMP